MKDSKVETVAELQAVVAERYSPAEADLIERAARTAEKLHHNQTRASGEAYISHPLQVANILIDLALDSTAIAAALLHDTLEDTILTREDLKASFGEEVESLVFGVTKIAIVNENKKNFAEAETIRKMFFAMVKDVRVILIKLADKLHNMRTLQYKEAERQKIIAQDTLDIYAPLAGRLGISWMKDELEDLSLKFLQPDVYQQIKNFVAQKRDERAGYLERVQSAIVAAAAEEQMTVDVRTRAKHFYSIYNKMKVRNKQLDEIYDLLGIRILCDELYQCYVVLGIIHRLWKPIEGRFKDYIAMPKANRYQSLHTTVMGLEGKLLEIQIRTHEMDETAQNGVAAHWVYKQTGRRQRPDHSDLELISRFQDMNAADLGSVDFLEDIKRELLKDSIYVFTPKGDVIQLPAGATAIDFAYHIHTEVGNHAQSARADGVIIPLRTALKNTQVIEIITNATARPHVDWLRFVRTAKTRNKIRAWLNHHDSTVIVDRNIVARKPETPPPRPQPGGGPSTTGPGVPPGTPTGGVRVEGLSNMMIRFATCCAPVTGDDIVGYVSRGRGIIVHRRDCKNLAGIDDFRDRAMEVEWESVNPRRDHHLFIRATKDLNLYSELERLLRRHNGHLVEGKTDYDTEGQIEGRFTVNLPRLDAYKRFMKDLGATVGIGEIHDTDQEPRDY